MRLSIALHIDTITDGGVSLGYSVHLRRAEHDGTRFTREETLLEASTPGLGLAIKIAISALEATVATLGEMPKEPAAL
jgi:hypothetical protein